MLSHPGGLVKYPLGKGGIVLNQLDLAERPDPAVLAKQRRVPGHVRANLQKKAAIYANLLRNMGASFSAQAAAPPEP